MITLRNTAWALTTVMAMDPVDGPGGTVMPSIEHAGALRMFTSQAWERVRELFETHLGGAPWSSPPASTRSGPSGTGPAHRAVLPGVGLLRREPHQALQAGLGHHRNGVRRPSRAVRAGLLGQRGPGQDRRAQRGAARRARRPARLRRRGLPGRLRPRRLDARTVGAVVKRPMSTAVERTSGPERRVADPACGPGIAGRAGPAPGPRPLPACHRPFHERGRRHHHP